MAWRCLLTGALKAEALRAVDDIAVDLEAAGANSSASLSAGHAGLALFHGQLAISGRGDDSRRLADEHLDRALEILSSAATSSLGLLNGASGVGWVLHHLTAAFSGASSPAVTQDLDAAIGSALTEREWAWELDYAHGLAGIAGYFLDHPASAMAARMLERICEILSDRAEHGASGICWRTPPRFRSSYRELNDPRGDVDLGLAHGIPGIIAVLGRAAGEHGIALARELRDHATEWFRGQAMLEGEMATPLSVPFFLGEREAARSAWCYGNPGAATGLFISYASTGDAAGQAWAQELAHAECRRPPGETGVVDATLCHGAAGLAHMYNRLYQASGDEELAAAARRWLEAALAMRRTGGCGGFMNWWPEEKRWHAETGLLVGAAGVGLALLAAACDAEPAWDRIFLLSRR